jgi:hypothetical protein
MAMDALASVAHAAGFAMVPEDDVTAAKPHGFTHKIASDRSVSRSSENTVRSARWQGSAQPVGETSQHNSSIFDWMPSFSWRADGR